MKIAITGASGLIGSALTRSLEQDGHTVQPVVRGETGGSNDVRWSVLDQTIEAEKLIGTDAVIHLAGEPLVGVRGTEEKKRRVLQSRVDGTGLIARTLATVDGGPQILVSASGVGYYGSTSSWVDETSPQGEGFLAEVCAAWEDAAQPARDAGLRVAHARLAPVLSTAGGALEQMLPVFKFGLGGTVGDGSQYFPWIAIDDAIRALRFLLDHEVAGPANVVAPNPVTNERFTEALADALGRPAFFRVPKFAVRAALGEMGEQTLLTGQRARPRVLLDAGFEFEFPKIEAALEHVLGS